MKIKAAAGLLVLSLVACESENASIQTQKKMARMFLEQQHRYEAELIAERNGPSIAPKDYKMLTAALSFRHEKEQMELARYARFQMEQKIALAQASSPRMLITNGGEISSEYRQVEYRKPQQRREIPLSGKQTFVGLASSSVKPNSDREQVNSSRFYQRQIQEDSAKQAEVEYDAKQASSQESEQDAPYAIPIPGRPGYVTIPPKLGGDIDVRGYAPGSLVMDPWTKTIVRVP